ncbi:hypothetical protein [Thermococcus sp.]|uniref:hypothetical protein n=1 Tax=Thermococcus sp. TaxID=35749 RepID=UPI002608AEDB|nr:hypothetical protein [Thermococcus sp.]
MEDNGLLVTNIGWSPRGWQGFDDEMFKNRNLYQFDYIVNTGFGHELWNFYEHFRKNVYFGHIESNPQKFTAGTVLFVSKYIDPRDPAPGRSRFYFVGVYGHALYDPQGFRTGVRVIDLLPEEAVNNIKKIVETGNWRGNNPTKHINYLKSILEGEEYTARLVASKKYSTVLLPIQYNGYVELDPQDICVKDFREWKITYKITPEKAIRLIDIAIFRHERIINNELEITPPKHIRKKAIEVVSKLKRIKKIIEASV